MVKIIIGLVMVIGGLTGKLVLIGTNSGVALAAFGAVRLCGVSPGSRRAEKFDLV